jgi:predicted MFS family arabinose efflux permease
MWLIHYVKNLFSLYANHFKGLSWPLWLGLTAVFINAFGSMVTMYLSLYFATSLQFSMSFSGTLMMVFGLGAILGAYVGGHLCDRYAAENIAIYSLLANAGTLFLLKFIVHCDALIFLLFLMGATNSAFVPASRLWLMQAAERDTRHQVNSLRYMVFNLGLGMAVFIGGWIAQWSYIILFMFNAAAVFISALIFIILSAQKHVTSVVTKASQQRRSLAAWLPFFSEPTLAMCYFILLVVSLLFSQLKITYPIYLHDVYHLNTEWFGYLFLINIVLVMFFQIPLLNAIKKFNQITVAGMGCFLVAAGMSIIMFQPSYLLAIGSCLFWTIGEILVFPIIQLLIYEKAEEQTKGMHMGLYQTIYALANVVGPLAGSLLYPLSNGRALWLICGFLGLVTLSFTILFWQRESAMVAGRS